jgi:precorrin-6B methylase 2
MKDKYERELRIKEDKIDMLCKNIQDLQVTNTKILETNKNLEESNKKLEDITVKQSEDIKKLLSNSNELLEQHKIN